MRERSRRAVLGVVAAAAAVACQGNPIPLSAQKGSTVMIPLAGLGEEDMGLIGFGSAVYDDRQRGSLVFRLDGPNGPELATRVTTALAGPLASAHGYGAPFGARSDLIVSMVDIPDRPEITVGSHTLFVARRLGGVDFPGPDYRGSIDILPASVASDGIVIEGHPTPFVLPEQDGFDVTTFVDQVVPHPQAVFAAATAARAVELEVTYPSAQIDVRDVTEALLYDDPLGPPDWPAAGVSQSHRALTWWKVASPGVLTVGMLHPDRALRGVSVVFELKAAATQPIAAASVQIRNARAWDASGNVLAPGWSSAWIR